MRGIMAAVVVGAVIMAAGCGSAATPSSAGRSPTPQPSSHEEWKFSSARALAELIAGRAVGPGRAENGPAGPVQFRDIEYYADVWAPRTTHAFTAFATVARDITVQPSSAATVNVFGDKPPAFQAAGERERWEAAGRPALEYPPSSGEQFSVPAGSYSFLPQGGLLTYGQVRSAAPSPESLDRLLLARLRGFDGVHPPVTVIFKDLGFMLATAPLKESVRSAGWVALARVQGLQLCGTGKDGLGRIGEWLCVKTGGEETGVLVDTRAFSVLAIEDRITKPSAFYPGVPAGDIIGLDTFKAAQ
jgi:hypothetical protein